MTKEISIEKAKKLSKIAEKVVKIFYKASIVFAFLFGALFILTAFLPDRFLTVKSLGNSSFSIDMQGMLRYNLKGAAIDGNLSIKAILLAICTAAVFYSIALADIFNQLNGILKSVSENNPFDIKNPGRIRRIGSILIVGSIVFNIINGAVAKTIVDTFSIPNISIVFSADLMLIFSGLLLLVLSGVFKHGSYLQNEYDTTL